MGWRPTDRNALVAVVLHRHGPLSQAELRETIASDEQLREWWHMLPTRRGINVLDIQLSYQNVRNRLMVLGEFPDERLKLLSRTERAAWIAELEGEYAPGPFVLERIEDARAEGVDIAWTVTFEGRHFALRAELLTRRGCAREGSRVSRGYWERNTDKLWEGVLNRLGV